MSIDVGRELQSLKARLERLERSPRLSHAAIDDTSVEVRDGQGNLRALLGIQGDGTTAVNVVNGAAPPVPSTPTAAPAIGGIAVGWDGKFANNTAIPLDWSRVEVHASATPGFTPTSLTLQATIETAQGGISYVPFFVPAYVCLVARNTSGAASAPTTVIGPYSPKPVSGEIGPGEIVSTMINDGAVTTPKLFANAVTTPKLAVGSVDATAIAVDALTGKIITGGTITGALLQTAATGQRITLNEAGANKILVYSPTTAIGELSDQGLLVKGTNGAVLWLDPNNAFPNLRLTNASGTNSAVINVSGPSAVLGMNSGTFTVGSYTDMKWRTLFGTASGSDFWAAERVRDSNTATTLGGRIFLGNTTASIGYNNSDDTTQNNLLFMQVGVSQFTKSRLEVYAPASSGSALYVKADSGYTGNMIRLDNNGTDAFRVDASGNATVPGVLNAASMITGSVSITPSAANTPTSALVTYSAVPGTTFRGFATANTTVPGVRAPTGNAGVTGVAVSSVTSTSMLVWVNRENTTATTVNWQVIGS
ncbi:hypothetical protein AB0454_22895 [Streptomyces sp. NPDC093509]|uniref:hypothetical protein n=1 Tax=Streptomyces sp. NPDC093509 TaxID=3154982 RepID=UPI00344C219E